MIFCFLIDFLKFCLLSLKLWLSVILFLTFLHWTNFCLLGKLHRAHPWARLPARCFPIPRKKLIFLDDSLSANLSSSASLESGSLTGCSLKVAYSIWSTVLLSLTILWCALSILRSIRYIPMPTLGANIQLLLDSASSQYLTSNFIACVHAHSVEQSCLTLWDPRDCSLPGSIVCGIILARILEWVFISFSRDFPDPGIKPMSSASPALVLVNTL